MKYLFQMLSCGGDKWSAKVQKVSKHLKELCRKYNFFPIDNCKFIKIRHANKSGIHLNK